MLIGIVIAAGTTGCVAKLAVRKVLPGHEGDSIHGYRYYLSRPYVVVQEKILVSETIRLAELDPKTRIESLKPKAVEITSGGKVKELSAAEANGLKKHLDAETGIIPVAASQEEVLGPPPPPVTALDTVPSGAGQALGIPNTPQAPPNTGTTATLAGKIRVVFMPDFDEQYAVQSKGFLTKNAYNLTFRHGWELTGVGAENDSTTVAIELLNAIDKALGASQRVAEADIDRRKNIADELKKRESDKDRFDGVNFNYVQETIRTYIKPGVYRINKPWEMEGGLEAQCNGSSLLANLGLTLYQVTETQVLPAPRVNIDSVGKPLSGVVGK